MPRYSGDFCNGSEISGHLRYPVRPIVSFYPYVSWDL